MNFEPEQNILVLKHKVFFKYNDAFLITSKASFIVRIYYKLRLIFLNDTNILFIITTFILYLYNYLDNKILVS